MKWGIYLADASHQANHLRSFLDGMDDGVTVCAPSSRARAPRQHGYPLRRAVLCGAMRGLSVGIHQHRRDETACAGDSRARGAESSPDAFTTDFPPATKRLVAPRSSSGITVS